MEKILFVCHGNICRSPMAEFVFRDMAERAGRGEFEAASAAVSSEEIVGGVGNPVYPPVASLLRRKGIDCAGKRARLLTAADGERYDRIICMDEDNMRRARRILGEKNAHKCVKLLSFAGSDADVSDPWYTRDFEGCYLDIVRGIKAFFGGANKN